MPLMLTDEQMVGMFEYSLEAQGEIFYINADKDIDANLEYTAAIWRDGSPVVKYFSRNDPAPIHIPKGTIVPGVLHVTNSGLEIFDFRYGKAWFRTHAGPRNTALGCELQPYMTPMK